MEAPSQLHPPRDTYTATFWPWNTCLQDQAGLLSEEQVLSVSQICDWVCQPKQFSRIESCNASSQFLASSPLFIFPSPALDSCLLSDCKIKPVHSNGPIPSFPSPVGILKCQVIQSRHQYYSPRVKQNFGQDVQICFHFVYLQSC